MKEESGINSFSNRKTALKTNVPYEQMLKTHHLSYLTEANRSNMLPLFRFALFPKISYILLCSH
jgi:hypothetical protein